MPSLRSGILGFLSRVRLPKRETTVEIITVTPVSIRFCKLDTCDMLGRFYGVEFGKNMAEEYPEEVQESYLKVMKLIEALNRRCYAKVTVIEAMTPLGFFKLAKYGGEKLPVIVVNGSKIHEGIDWNPEELSEKICSMTSS
ncbi:MAG: hypothetical protein ACK4H7_03915 [Acidilobaceae archaeon]